MEKVFFNKNGQWSLIKSWTPKQQKDMVFGYGEAGSETVRDSIPPASGKMRSNMMTHLQNRTKSRINPETGEKEYRLFRAHTSKDDRYKTQRSAWSTDPDMCLYWADVNRYDPNKEYFHPRQKAEDAAEEKKYGKYQISAAWIPEKHIHSYLPPLQDKYQSEKEEGEALVMPHDIKIDKIIKGSKLNNLINKFKMS